MAFDAFLKIEGIPGESTDDKHKDWIEVLSYHHNMHQNPSGRVSSEGGATSGRVNMGDLMIVKRLDIASPKLAEYCCTGQHIPSVKLEICRAGGDKLKYMEYKLGQVIISSYSPGGTTHGGDEVPLEEISFNFGKIEWTYQQQKRATGQAGGNASSGWDLTLNKKV
jgi:type VI secretion system secreted protein Hcp